MQSKKDFRNSLWQLSQAERSRALLANVRTQQSRAHVTGYGRTVDSLSDAQESARHAHAAV